MTKGEGKNAKTNIKASNRLDKNSKAEALMIIS
jgi:hypothetical protein